MANACNTGSVFSSWLTQQWLLRPMPNNSIDCKCSYHTSLKKLIQDNQEGICLLPNLLNIVFFTCVWHSPKSTWVTHEQSTYYMHTSWVHTNVNLRHKMCMYYLGMRCQLHYWFHNYCNAAYGNTFESQSFHSYSAKCQFMGKLLVASLYRVSVCACILILQIGKAIDHRGALNNLWEKIRNQVKVVKTREGFRFWCIWYVVI